MADMTTGTGGWDEAGVRSGVRGLGATPDRHRTNNAPIKIFARVRFGGI